MSEPITHIYLVVYETDMSGAWTTPEEAVEHEFNYSLKEEGGIYLSHTDKLFTTKEAIEQMLKPNCDYPYLAKVKLNPTNDSEKWVLDR